MIELEHFYLNPKEPMPPCPELKSGQVHVWHISLESLQEIEVEHLDEQEIKRSEAFYFLKDKNVYKVSRSYLKKILGLYMGTEPEKLLFRLGSKGKPYLQFPVSDLQFNMTHSNQLILIAVTRQNEIGIDVEHLRPVETLQGVIENQFSMSEQKTLKNCPREEQSKLFFQLWTSKEAFLKAFGTGIREGLQNIALKPEAAIIQDLLTLQTCHYVQFFPSEDYVATLAIIS